MLLNTISNRPPYDSATHPIITPTGVNDAKRMINFTIRDFYPAIFLLILIPSDIPAAPLCKTIPSISY
jgi:hypothetical protein